MVSWYEENKVVNIGEMCELPGKRLARFDGFVGILKEKHSIESEREEA